MTPQQLQHNRLFGRNAGGNDLRNLSSWRRPGGDGGNSTLESTPFSQQQHQQPIPTQPAAHYQQYPVINQGLSNPAFQPLQPIQPLQNSPFPFPRHQIRQQHTNARNSNDQDWPTFDDSLLAGAGLDRPLRNAGNQRNNGAGRGRGGSGGFGQQRGGQAGQQSRKPQQQQHLQKPKMGNGDYGDYGGMRNQGRQQMQRGNMRGMTGQQKGQSQRPLPTDFIDEAYLDNNYEKINPANYPKSSKGKGSGLSDPKGFFASRKQQRQIDYDIRFEQRDWFVRCYVTMKLLDGRVIEVYADNAQKKGAERLALKHGLLKLHNEKLLMGVITAGQPQKLDKELLAKEADAKLDIYEYCVRFEGLPTIYTTVKTAGVEVVIEFPQQGIRATGFTKERKSAEIMACLDFKRQAEEYHKQNAEEDIILKDASSLNSQNADKFFEHLRFTNKINGRWEVETKSPKGNSKLSGSYQESWVTINGEMVGEPVQASSKKLSVACATLTGAFAMKQQFPDAWPGFVRALIEGQGEILKPINPIRLNLGNDEVMTMTDTLYSVRRLTMKPEEVEQEEESFRMQRGPIRQKLNPQQIEMKSKLLLQNFQKYNEDPNLEELRRKRAELPMNKFADKVIDLVNNNPTSIIVGATGSGKTTQVPQILLEDAIKSGNGGKYNIICTQPRRIAATSVATRVAVERHEPLRKTVGYQVRFDSKIPETGGSITFCTTGILLQQLRHSADEALDGVTHLLIDEVHERDILIDFLLILLKRTMKARRLAGKPEIKIVLMSATMDTEMFAGYFSELNDDGSKTLCPALSVPGRTFPVKELFLDDIHRELTRTYSGRDLALLNDKDTKDYLASEQAFPAMYRAGRVPPPDTRLAIPAEEGNEDATIDWKAEVTIGSDGQAAVANEKEDALVPIGLVGLTVAHIVKTTTEGAILVFMPGLQEIQKLDELIRKTKPLGIDFENPDKFKITLLHSSIPTDKDVFENIQAGCRKIIISTNIAETSVTIPDVQFVVDTGKLREKQYDQGARITRLLCTWVSKSNSKQRAGRAGRVQNGNYYALFTKTRWESFRSTGLPEMLRSDLQEICLDIKAQGFNDPVAEFLSEAIEPPKGHAVDASVSQLMKLAAFDEDEKLTPLGKVLATLPVEPALGKMILMGVIFRCLDPIMVLAAASCGRDLFLGVPDRKKEINRARDELAGGTGSDHLAILNGFRNWRKIRQEQGAHAAFQYADENWLHRGALKTVEQIGGQIEEILMDAGLIPRASRNERTQQTEFGGRSLNEYSSNESMILALLTAGLYPNIAISSGGRGLRTNRENFAMVHPSSVNYQSGSRSEPGLRSGILVAFASKAKSTDGSSLYLKQTSQVSPLQAFLFGGMVRYTVAQRLEMDRWLPFYAPMTSARVLTEFRKCLDRLLETAFSELSTRKGKDGQSRYLSDDPAREVFARGLVEVLDIHQKNEARNGFGPSGFSSGGFGSRDMSRLNSRDNSRAPSRNSMQGSLGFNRDNSGISRTDSRQDMRQDYRQDYRQDSRQDFRQDSRRDDSRSGGFRQSGNQQSVGVGNSFGSNSYSHGGYGNPQTFLGGSLPMSRLNGSGYGSGQGSQEQSRVPSRDPSRPASRADGPYTYKYNNGR